MLTICHPQLASRFLLRCMVCHSDDIRIWERIGKRIMTIRMLTLSRGLTNVRLWLIVQDFLFQVALLWLSHGVCIIVLLYAGSGHICSGAYASSLLVWRMFFNDSCFLVCKSKLAVEASMFVVEFAPMLRLLSLMYIQVHFFMMSSPILLAGWGMIINCGYVHLQFIVDWFCICYLPEDAVCCCFCLFCLCVVLCRPASV